MSKWKNTLFTNDNLFVLNSMNSESVDLIYLDPPFNSKRTYSAPIGSKSAGASFKDMWSWADVNTFYLERMFTDYPFLVNFIQSIEGIHGKAMMAYVTYITQRLIEMHRMLKPTGSLYLHIDPTASHYLKIVLDKIFGKDNFRNEIAWCYGSGGASKSHFSRKHDTIFFYTKSSKHIFNVDEVREPYSSPEKVKHKIINGKKYKRKHELGRIPFDWWQIPILTNTSKERTGYPTQKPLALLHRIIKASSKEGDVVFDPFCGCATACVAAQQLNRKWVGIDIEEKAAQVLIDRLSNDSGLFSDFIHRTDVPQRTDIKQVEANKLTKEALYDDQKGVCNGCQTKMDIWHFEIDHIVLSSKGGGDYYENYQLLCGNCNRTKGNRPMEYLMQKIKAREALLKSQLTFGT